MIHELQLEIKVNVEKIINLDVKYLQYLLP